MITAVDLGNAARAALRMVPDPRRTFLVPDDAIRSLFVIVSQGDPLGILDGHPAPTAELSSRRVDYYLVMPGLDGRPARVAWPHAAMFLRIDAGPHRYAHLIGYSEVHGDKERMLEALQSGHGAVVVLWEF
jgi:hypothetical protein